MSGPLIAIVMVAIVIVSSWIGIRAAEQHFAAQCPECLS